MNKTLLVIVGIVTSAIAQTLLKKSGNYEFFKDNLFFFYFVLGGVFYVASFLLYTYLLKVFDISKISPIMTIGTMILVVLVGVFAFKEILSIRQIIGIVFGIVSVLLIIK